MKNFCGRCGEKINPENNFCPRCGIPIKEQNNDIRAEKISEVEIRPSKKNKKRKILMSVFGLIVISAVGSTGFFLYAKYFNKGQSSSEYTPLLTSGQSAIPRTIEETIVDKIISVPTGKYAYYQIKIPNDALGSNIVGDFRAYGGSGNDIEVVLMDKDAFVNWSNQHEVNVYYSSGKKTLGKIDISLSPGEYYLVFSNTFSLLSDKQVEAKIKLILKVF